MSGYNLPDDWSQRAFDAHFGDDQKAEEEKCPNCGAGPDEACEPGCGLTCEDVDEDELMAFWGGRSELFAPPWHGMDWGVE